MSVFSSSLDSRTGVLSLTAGVASALAWPALGWTAWTRWETFYAMRHGTLAVLALTLLAVVPASFRMRARLLVLTLACTAAAGFVQFAIPPGSFLCAHAAVSIAALFLGPIEASAVFLSLSVALVGAGVAHVGGWVAVRDSSALDPTIDANWVRFYLIFAITSMLVSTSVSVLVHRLDRALAESRALVARLQAEQDRRTALEAERVASMVAAEEAGRFDVIGRFAAGVAHDFQNHLAAIQGSADALRGGGDPRREAAAITEATRAAAAMTRQLLATARHQELRASSVGVAEAVDRALRSLLPTLSPGIRVVRQVDPLAAVLADPSHLERVLTNLLSNARDALPGGGRIVVGTRAAPEGVIEIVVSDDGEGMDAATQSRLFEPYFTTKGERGSGIGLATVRSLVTQWGGQVAVVSALGQGSTFIVQLPKAAQRPIPAPAPTPEPPPITARPEPRADLTERPLALVVDDDALVLSATSRLVQSLGYRVVSASGVAAALDVLRDQRPAVICTDWRMPGLPVTSLLATAAERKIPVVVCSGAIDDDLAARDGEVTLLNKPFSAAELRRAIGETQRTATS